MGSVEFIKSLINIIIDKPIINIKNLIDSYKKFVLKKFLRKRQLFNSI